MRRRLIIANWKENKTNEETAQFINSLREAIPGECAADIVICPSFVSIITASDCARGSHIRVGAQDVSVHDNGAFTGEVSAWMLKDFCDFVIVGHSERRREFGETDDIVNRKARAVLANGMRPVICIGESMEERKSGRTEEVVLGQVSGCLGGIAGEDAAGVVVAYEPLWAISGGDSGHEPATPDDAQAVHAMIRRRLSELFGGDIAGRMRIVYGGSIRPENFGGFLDKEDIDGVLVGSASLDSATFARLLEP